VDVTGRNVYMGLAGFLLVDPADNSMVPAMMPTADTDEREMLRTRIPGCANILTTGCTKRFDIPLVIQDRVFGVKDGKANQLIYNPFDFDGVIGDTFLVNGANQPFMEVERRKYLVRMLNGSNARVRPTPSCTTSLKCWKCRKITQNRNSPAITTAANCAFFPIAKAIAATISTTPTRYAPIAPPGAQGGTGSNPPTYFP